MLRNRLYYGIKPLVPSTVRRSVRRWFALRKRQRVHDIWPILPGSERRPDGWPGWPDDKEFAFVLTHDVESQAGLERVRQLAEMEIRLGFRSSFNFIPEGPYKVRPELRSWLTDNGFEVGVHDLHHNGKLFHSENEFRHHAARINHHLKEWGAVGFRAGFMMRRLPWLHQLNIEYDASTFDTDPFEPQPEGAGTIFPFFVQGKEKGKDRPQGTGQKSQVDGAASPGLSTFDLAPSTGGPAVQPPAFALAPPPSALRPAACSLTPSLPHSAGAQRHGYIELPCTMPQDSTLFLLLKCRDVQIWNQKLQWLRDHRGMVLMNVHPDYLNFDNHWRSGEYPARLYEEFLRSVAVGSDGAFWNPCAGQLSRWYTSSMAQHEPIPPALTNNTTRVRIAPDARPLASKRAAVVLFSYYPADPRPRRAAEAMADAGMTVDLICLRESQAERKRERVNGVNVRRIPLRRRRGGFLSYVLQYSTFFAACATILAVRTLARRYDVIHAHNMPDFLVYCGMIPRLFGARIILDLHDPMPELMRSIHSLPPHNRMIRILEQVEKRCTTFADQVITTNVAFSDLFASRGCPREKIRIVMNSPQGELFDADQRAEAGSTDAGRNGTFQILYHGLIVERHGLDAAIHAVAKLRGEIPNLRFHIFGSRTPYMDQMTALIDELDLKSVVQYHGYRPQQEIARTLATIDLGIIPNRRTPFTECNLPTRIFENLAMRKPVVAPDTRGIRDYFGPDQLLFFRPEDPNGLAEIIKWVYDHPEETRHIVDRGRSVLCDHSWEKERNHFLEGVRRLLEPAHT